MICLRSCVFNFLILIVRIAIVSLGVIDCVVVLFLETFLTGCTEAILQEIAQAVQKEPVGVVALGLKVI